MQERGIFFFWGGGFMGWGWGVRKKDNLKQTKLQFWMQDINLVQLIYITWKENQLKI